MQLTPAQTLDQVAELIEAEYIGDPNFQITGLNEIHMVQAGDLTFVDHPKYYSKALHSNATTIIINTKVECPEGKALIFHDDPFAACVSLVKKFRPFVPATAMVSDSAEIGEGTII